MFRLSPTSIRKARLAILNTNWGNLCRFPFFVPSFASRQFTDIFHELAARRQRNFASLTKRTLMDGPSWLAHVFYDVFFRVGSGPADIPHSALQMTGAPPGRVAKFQCPTAFSGKGEPKETVCDHPAGGRVGTCGRRYVRERARSGHSRMVHLRLPCRPDHNE